MYVVVLVTLAVASGLGGLVDFVRSGRAGLGYLWVPYPGFDFYDYTPRFPFLHTPAFFHAVAFPWVYPAPAIFVLYPFYLFAKPTHWLGSYVAFAALASAAALWLAWRFSDALVQRGLGARQAAVLLGATMVLGWPFYFALQRGNIEAVLWVGLAGGIVCFARDQYVASALLLGVFGSAKLYPLLFLGLFVRRRHLRFLAMGIAAAVATTLAGLRMLEPDVRDAYLQIRAGVRSWTEITTLVYWPGGVGPDHSLLGLLREATKGAILRPPHALETYLVTAGILAGVLFLWRMRRLPAPNQVLFLGCTAILLPPTSYDYTLLLLLIPWAWMVLLCVQAAQVGQDVHRFTLPWVLFGVALAPLTFLHTYGAVPLYFAGPVRCVALLGLLAFSAWRPARGATGGERMTGFGVVKPSS